MPDLSRLIAALPSGALSFDRVDEYSVDGMAPSVVVKPASQAEVAAALGAANEAGAAVVPFGGGTQQGLGMPLQRYDVAVDLRQIDSLIEYEAADLTATVEAGMRLSTLQRLLGERGQWLPVDPLLSEDATIGGVLATNASGPARLSRGTARDLVIGMTVVTAEGELVKSGGRVVKNVAGYDLAKLHIGALGTLGVIVQVSFKLAPLAVRAATLAVRGEAATLTRLHGEIEAARLPLEASVLGKGAGEAGWALGVRFAAGDTAVERSLREARGLAAGLGLNAESLDETGWRALLPNYVATTVARASVLPSRVKDIAEALAGAGAAVSALPGVGVAYGSWAGEAPLEALRELRTACVEQGGALVIERAAVETKGAIDVWGEPRGGFELMQRLKAEMDPKRILSPGRFVGGI